MKILKRWLLISVLFLSACASKPDVVLKPEEVDVVVPVTATLQCPAKPILPTSQLAKNATMTDTVRALLEDRAVLQGYAARLFAAASCNATVTTTP